MKMIVTGGCGFIGSHLVDKLIELNHEVVVIDLLQTNLNPKATYLITDINDLEGTSAAYNNAACVFHLAAEVQVQSSFEDPLKTFITNVIGIQTVLENMRKHKVPKIIFSSSSAVYGDAVGPIKETHSLNPLNPYALSKKIGEELITMYAKLYHIEFHILRYFNVYGPRQKNTSLYSGVISVFLQQRKNNNPLFVTGDGTQTRDFVYITDVIDANIAALNTNKNTVLNIATGHSISIIFIAKQLSNNIVFIAPRLGEIKHSEANIQKARSVLNWSPKRRIHDQTYDWYGNI
jgi:UDP-glucose 4-epimerase